MKLYSYMLGILCLTSIISCKKEKVEETPPPVVKQDPVLKLIRADVDSVDAAHIEGKIIAPSWLGTPAYGIVYSTDSIPTVYSPGKIELGKVRDSVNIAYVVKDLDRWKNYNFRLYMSKGDTIWYSESKQVVPPSFQIAPFKDAAISRNTLLTVNFKDYIPTDQLQGFQVFVGDKKIDSVNFYVDQTGYIKFLVPIDYTAGTPITIKKGAYSQTTVPNLPILPGYWRKITSHDGKIAEDAAYFTLGNKGYIVGGHGYLSETKPINTIWEIDLTTLQWKQKNPFPTVIHSAMCVVVNDKAYLFGGVVDGSTPNEKVWEYDPAADSWQTISTMPNDLPGLGRLRMTTTVYNGKVYMGSGIKLDGPPSYFERWYSDYWQTFDPATRTWQKLPDMPADNSIQSMTGYINNNKLYCFGGDNSYHEVNENFIFDFSTNTWSKPDITRPLPTRTAVSVITKNSNTYFYGGYAYLSSTGPSGGRFGMNPEFWKMDANQQFTQLASTSTVNFVSALNRNAPIFATANGFIVYNVSIWGGNRVLTSAVIEYVPN